MAPLFYGGIVLLGKHLLGIYEKAFDSSLSWGERFESARSIGFDFLELSIDESDMRLERLKQDSSERAAIAQASRDYGVPILSMCLSAHRRFPLGSMDPGTRRMSLDIMESAIDLAAELGVRTIQLAAYDVYYEQSTPETRELYYIGLQKVVEMAEQRCVMLANEIMDTGFVNSVSRHLEYERAANSPWLKLYPDLGNLTAWGNDVASELRRGKGSIVQVHLKDTLAVRPGFSGKFRDVPFGSGCVDFPLCFSVLERTGYSGPYLIEIWHKPGINDRETITSAKKYIEQCFNDAGELSLGRYAV